MTWFQEMIDFVSKLKPFTTVEEYQTGLYYWWGAARERRINEEKLIKILERKKASTRGDKIKVNDKLVYLGIDEIRKLEEDVNKLYKQTKTIPEGWYLRHEGLLRREKVEHPARYSKNLPYGVYLHIPEMLDISRVVTMPARPVVKDLGYLNILAKIDSHEDLLNYDLNKSNSLADIKVKTLNNNSSSDGRAAMLANQGLVELCLRAFTRYEVEDGYFTFTNVQDWENTYHSEALLRISEHTRGTHLKNWVDKDFVEGIEMKVKNVLNGPEVRDKWGIWTYKIGISDAGIGSMNRNINELYAPDGGLVLHMIGDR